MCKHLHVDMHMYMRDESSDPNLSVAVRDNHGRFPGVWPLVMNYPLDTSPTVVGLKTNYALLWHKTNVRSDFKINPFVGLCLRSL